MTKEMYVARDKNGNVWQFSHKPWLDISDSVFRNTEAAGTFIKANVFNIALEPLQCVKVTIDTLNQSYRVDRVPQREDGYYTATNRDRQVTWIIQSKDDVWYYYHGGAFGDTDNMKIGTKPIPAECLP